ncbi:hypothetical protein KFE26_03690 [Shewanella sp. M16]|uniref:hypothetical protein n=1 Tax=Shewanella TaxID=22 RepID=UPI001BB098F6|nr:hypothetical protein [Shewanella sp. M16]MBS0041414.1 hypothetical protein [Shewanella sp. M16]
MINYRNLGGDSNVIAYQITEQSITVQFASGRFQFYLYDYANPGAQVVERMKELAQQGRGLNSYISTTVKTRFARKW